MKTVVIGNPKGGAGKTTLAIVLATQFGQFEKTCILDFDLQATLTKWHRRRQDVERAAELYHAHTPVNQLPQALGALEKQGVEKVFIDTGPGFAQDMVRIVCAADLLLIPCRPSLADVEAAVSLVTVAKKRDVPFSFVINSVRPNAKQTAQTIALLSKHGPVVEYFLGDRTIYMDCLPAGLAPGEMRRTHKAAIESGLLGMAINEQLLNQDRKETADA